MSTSTEELTVAEQDVSALTLPEVIETLARLEKSIYLLYRRFHELNHSSDTADKRSQFNPERNLKIAAFRSYEWAKEDRCPAEVARERAISATIISAKGSYPATIVDGSLPASVVAYIDQQYTEYHMTDEQKKAYRKELRGKTKAPRSRKKT